MASCKNGHYGTAEFHDPYCDPCHRDKGVRVKVHCFCNDCRQHLCSSCYIVHDRLCITKKHLLSWGDMPKSLTERPPKLEVCEIHASLLKDQFCSNHKKLLCPCCKAKHSECAVDSIADACKFIPASESNDLCNAISGFKWQLETALSFVGKHGKILEDQKKTMLIDTQKMYDQVLAKISKSFQDVKDEIKAQYESQVAYLTQSQQKMTDMKDKLEAVSKDIENIKGNTIDTIILLQLQESREKVRQYIKNYKCLRGSLRLDSLTFSLNKTFQEILSSSLSFGSISKSAAITPTVTDVLQVKFPAAPFTELPAAAARTLQRNGTASGSRLTPLEDVKAFKVGSYDVRLKHDKLECAITGIAITHDGRRILADSNNGKIKLFSPDMTFLSSVSVPSFLWDVTVLNEREAAVTVDSSIFILDIVSRRLRIKEQTTNFGQVRGIAKSIDKLVITVTNAMLSPGYVKMTNERGKIYWSLEGRSPFTCPHYVSCFVDGKSSKIIVADSAKRILVFLNGVNGCVLARYEVKNTTKSRIDGVTFDTAGNILICTEDNIVFLSSDLSREKILVKKGSGELSGSPLAIAYDEIRHQIIVSFGDDFDNIDCFQLT